MDTNAEPTADFQLSDCSRRRILAALPGIVILPGVVAACSTDRSVQAASTVQQTTTVPSTTVSAAEVPVGSAKLVAVGTGGYGVVVAQPTAGKFVAFSNRCTHQGGQVQVVQDLLLRCPLHGAEFDAATGVPTSGPTRRPLDVVSVTVNGDTLTLA